MNRPLKVLLVSLALPLFAVGAAQAQNPVEICNPVVDGTGDPVVSASGLVVTNTFSAPCPVVPVAETAPVVAPEPAEFYLVFFDWDKANITPAGDAVIQQAVQAIGQGNPARIMVTGHTDTSGPADYNVGLSQRRAEAVQQRLAAYGVSAGSIQTDWQGETSLMVQTPDGVREPSNRRTEIELQ